MQLASHPLRWALLTELALCDRRVVALVATVDEPQSLVSYHLRLLRTSGRVEARRSSFEGRDSRYCLDLTQFAAAFGAAAAALHPALAPCASETRAAGASVLFLCIGDCARSPMAEALLRHRGRVCAASAGSNPRSHLNPRAMRILREDNVLDLGDRQTRALAKIAGQRLDYVITLWDKVREFSRSNGRAAPIHWSLPGPAAVAGSGRGHTFAILLCGNGAKYWHPISNARTRTPWDTAMIVSIAPADPAITYLIVINPFWNA